MTTHALVTGANGFVAQWAMRAMLERGWSVTGGGYGPSPDQLILNAAERARIDWCELDVTRQNDVSAVVQRSRADVVLHLAGISHVPTAANHPFLTYDVNTMGTVRLLSAVRACRDAGGSNPVILVIGSADQYGRHATDDMPLTELAEQRPLSVYAASKVAQETVALQMFRSDGLRVRCTRSFNHSGVGHASHFLLPALVARALALPRAGGTLAIGNGDTIRDYLHVWDAVSGYLALITDGTDGEVYNVSSGAGHSVRALARAVVERLGIAAEIGTETAYMRAADVPALVGDNSKLRRATGWAPQRSLDDIIDDLVHAATH
ncbi:MAG: GDP-mannose 4,6-dehydratase [Gemmatimonadota bacterium]